MTLVGGAEVSTVVVRRIAVEAEADPRSVLKEIGGEPVRGIVGERIRRLLALHGLPHSKQARP